MIDNHVRSERAAYVDCGGAARPSEVKANFGILEIL